MAIKRFVVHAKNYHAGKYRFYLEMKGYKVKKLDFTKPDESSHYNFFEYIRSTQDIVKVAHMLQYQEKGGGHQDPFWDKSAQLLLQAAIAYLGERASKNDQNLHNVLDFIELSGRSADEDDDEYMGDVLINNLEKVFPDSYAVKT